MTLNNLPSGWNREVFSNVIDINRKHFIRKGESAKYVEMKSLLSNQRQISSYEIKQFSAGTKFKNGDTLFAKMTSCLENGKIAYCSVLQEEEVGWGSTEFIVFSGIPSQTDNKYIYYLSRYDPVIKYAVANANGTDRQRVPRSSFDHLSINLPPIKEQKKIADVLSAFDDKIEINNKINNTLEKILSAIFNNYFVKYIPFQNSGFKSSELGLIPKNWEIQFLTDFVDFERGVEPGSKNYKGNKINENYIPFFRVGDLGSRNSKIFVEKNLVKNKFTMPDDILISLDGTAGIVRCGYEGAYSSGIRKCNLRDKGLFSKGLLYALLKSDVIQETIHKHATGTTIIHAGSSINYMRLALPPIKTLKSISFQIEPVFSNIINVYAQNKRIAQMRDALLPKLMSGEIRV